MIEKFLKELQEQGLQQRTLETYKYYLKHFEYFLEDIGFIDENNLIITDSIAKKFISYLKDKGLKPNSIKQILGRAKELVEYHGGIWKVSKRIYRERSEVISAKPFTELELRQVLSLLKQENLVYYYLSLILYGFGLRISEALGIKPDDVFEKENVLFINVRPEIAKFKKQRETACILKGDYKEDFINFILNRKKIKLKKYTLFTYYNDIQKCIIQISTKTANVYFYRFSKKHKIHVTPHRFRDTYITTLVTKGVRPLTASKWAGHKDISTTLKYYAKFTTREELNDLKMLMEV